MKNLKQLIIKLPEEQKQLFFEHCENNGYSPSKRLRFLINEDMRNVLKKQ